MVRDPLHTVLKLRQRAVDEARVTLAQAVMAESEAETRARAAEQEIEAETRRASDPDGGDELVEAFAAWLPGAQQRAALARAEEERMAADVVIRRAELAAFRTGLEVVETLLRQKNDARMETQARDMQRTIDEAGSRLVPPP